MKIKNLILFIGLTSLIAFSSCKKDEPLVFASMSATIGDAAWSATPAAVAATTYSDYLTIVGYNIAGQYMLISVHGTTAGTYDFEPYTADLKSYAIYRENKDEAGEDETYYTKGGKVVISSITDGKASGTYELSMVKGISLSGIETLEVKNGKFANVPIISGSEQ